MNPSQVEPIGQFDLATNGKKSRTLTNVHDDYNCSEHLARIHSSEAFPSGETARETALKPPSRKWKNCC